MKFENTEVFNFEGAIRGMRNPLESWEKSDSEHYDCGYVIGKNDLALMQKLIKAGSEHRKFMRQIFVSVDITAPIYWWKEFDTYRIGVTENSTSTMHKLASTPITIDCFEMDDFNVEDAMDDVITYDMKPTNPLNPVFEIEKENSLFDIWNELVTNLESLRLIYNKTKEKKYWKELIRLLPESWLQKRTVTMNYENILNMVHQRKNHKLSEWSTSFIEWSRSLPYAEELLFVENHNDKRKDN